MMRKNFGVKVFVILMLGAMACSGCSTVTVRPKGAAKLTTEPSYSSTKDYFFWGLMGEHSIDVIDVCGERKVLQMQAQDTFANGFLKIITLGIYSPRTANVWCEKGGA